jgi:hypothetical protein
VLVDGRNKRPIGKFAEENGINLGGKARCAGSSGGGDGATDSLTFAEKERQLRAKIDAALLEARQRALDKAAKRRAGSEERAAIKASLPDHLPLRSSARGSHPHNLDWVSCVLNA